MGTFMLVYTMFYVTVAKCNARDSHIPVLAQLPIGFAVFLVHLATIPSTGTCINPARSLGAALVYNRQNAWDDQEESCEAATIFLLDSALLGSFYLPKMSLPMI